MGQNTQQFELTVLTGLNAGVEVHLSAGRHSIGGAETDDIRLDGLAQTVADFALDKESIKVKPHVDTISAKPGGALAQGRVKSFKLPARISLTPDIDIFADKVAIQTPKRSLTKPLMAMAGVLVAAVVLTSIQVDFKFNATQATPAEPELAPTAQAALLAPASVTTAQAKTCTDCTSQAAEDLRQSLANAGILGLIVASGGGAVRVEGGLSDAERTKWSGIRSTFDAKWSMVPLLTSFTKAQDGAPLSVTSVWLGEPREIKTGAGETRRIGDIVSGGWTLSAIEEDFIELDQGDTKLRVNF